MKLLMPHEIETRLFKSHDLGLVFKNGIKDVDKIIDINTLYFEKFNENLFEWPSKRAFNKSSIIDSILESYKNFGTGNNETTVDKSINEISKYCKTNFSLFITLKTRGFGFYCTFDDIGMIEDFDRDYISIEEFIESVVENEVKKTKRRIK